VDLIVSDNGTGLPPNLNLYTSDSFGFKIVRLLVEQIEGEIRVQRANGAVFEITLPYEAGNNVS
jgi:two-component sensor histidine kinase